ncbi:MAG: hypothetical protein QOK35_421 [Pseudonocardiales bacterium]|nr:hypothetical protein [Pseudonocardiales bacterium]
MTVHDGRRTCGSLLTDLEVHPRVAMAILRHAQFAIMMEIYTEVSDAATRAGLMRLGDSLGRAAAVLRCCTGRDTACGKSPRTASHLGWS